MPTKQEIIDRVEALGAQYSKAYEAEQQRIAAERRSIQELCAGDGQGHFFSKNRHYLGLLSERRHCVFCGAKEG